ncbi:MAG: winged helix-turn-helix transcriptional regulator [Nitrososphaeria archaeon]
MSKKACMIVYGDREICIYPAQKIMRVLGKEYTLLIIGLLGNKEKSGFNEIARNVGNPRPNLLSKRLKELEEAGLVSRRVIPGIPVNTEYSLTEKGKKLRDLLIPVFEWIESFQNIQDLKNKA